MKSKAISKAPLLLVLFAITLSLCSCGKKQETVTSTSQAPSSGKQFKIGFCMTLDNPYWNNMRLGIMDEAKKLGAQVTIMNAEEDANKQIQQIKELIAKGVDLLCVVPMKKEDVVPGIKEANRKKVPVIIVNREIAAGCDYVTYTGVSTYEGAVASAEILMKAIGGKGDIIEFHQHPGSGPQLARSKALTDVMKKYPEVKLVSRIFHKGSRAATTEEMQTLLSDPTRSKNLKGIYVHGDDFAIAAAKACVARNRKDIAIVGMGGSEEALEAIKQGILTGTSYQKPEEEGRSAIRLAVQYLKGEKLKKEYLIPCPAVTKENAAQFKGEL